jgi:hypothetical protein
MTRGNADLQERRRAAHSMPSTFILYGCRPLAACFQRRFKRISTRESCMISSCSAMCGA